MSPKKEIKTISTRNPRKPKNSQTRNQLPKLTKNELNSLMCIQVTEKGLRLKEPEITFPFRMWLDQKKQERVTDQTTEDQISPSKVSENNCQEEIENKKKLVTASRRREGISHENYYSKRLQGGLCNDEKEIKMYSTRRFILELYGRVINSPKKKRQDGIYYVADFIDIGEPKPS
ncbi:hypothetical protein C922_05665 [Plasmodium inui San Antonio 1]|uniref:Uncharacterized protein n=1 Tax=Plasmodium inui San Antonio 1 TaxID=1237626 RepID=W6ZSQ8_9APIC|nr:hypothetical protein C922_05665 [Plasmodium inui San Antonio 1]EUD63952.1 hypothetical protein C922_05665 [Plasmodium inui San Antonio 1]